MKTTLIIGINWQQVANITTLEPNYHMFINNTKVFSIIFNRIKSQIIGSLGYLINSA